MAKQGENKKLETNFYPNQKDPAPYDKPHVWKDGEYVEVVYVAPDYPKVKYHADYVHNQNPLKEYAYTESAQLVKSEAEERELGDDWKDAPSVITCPNVKQVNERKKAIGANWRAAAELPADITDMHVAFLQAQGLGNINNIFDAHTFLSKLGSAAMNGFMKEAAEWNQSQNSPKRGPGRPKQEVTA